MKKYKKGNSFCSFKFYRKIIEKYLEIALKNSKKLDKGNKSQGKIKLKNKLPYTEIYKMINEFKNESF